MDSILQKLNPGAFMHAYTVHYPEVVGFLGQISKELLNLLKTTGWCWCILICNVLFAEFSWSQGQKAKDYP